MSLNVIQDAAQDGNLYCGIISTANDLLLQINQNYKYPEKSIDGSQIIKKMIFSTIASKTASKTLIDPQNSSESSLTNNLLMVSCYSALDGEN